MNTRLGAICLALFGAAAFAIPAIGHAGTIGYYGSCIGDGSKVTAIQNAGHTPVQVNTISAATLAPLDGLIVESCSLLFGYQANADIDAAVADGMLLVINDWYPRAGTNDNLPGAPAINFTYSLGNSINLASGSPITTGPGGTLTNASLDFAFGITRDGYTPTSLPPGMTQLLTTPNAGRTVALAYKEGNGLVAYNAMPLGYYLPNGGADFLGTCGYFSICDGMQTYLTNLLDWSIKQLVTCASEGYKGTQLTWCQNICESGLTGQKLDTWIHRWINRYRDLPYCAVVEEEEEQQD